MHLTPGSSVVALVLAAPLAAAAGESASPPALPETAADGPSAANAEAGGTAGRPALVSVGRDGVEILSPDGDFSLEIGGRLHADWVRHGSLAGGADDGARIRRARIALGGRLERDWRWTAETDFAGDAVAVKDFSLGYHGWTRVAVTAGQQKQPYSLALEMSSNDLPFVERGIDNALLAPFVDRAIGVRADAAGKRWFAAAGVFGGSTGDRESGWGASGRFVHAPILDGRRVLHLGFRAARREPDDAVRIRAETTPSSGVHVVDTGPIPSAETVTLLGPEVAFAAGPFSVAAEHTRARLEGTGADATFTAWHAAVTLSLGGATPAGAYDIGAGEFRNPSSAPGFARSWELAARTASIDLNDGGLAGGSERTFTIGASWYANTNVRMMLDWTRVTDTDASSALPIEADGLDVLTLRLQYAL
ncbi:MAG TPA: porin [Gammaproteobacteria bacterium]